jgi:hypothetical protein
MAPSLFQHPKVCADQTLNSLYPNGQAMSNYGKRLEKFLTLYEQLGETIKFSVRVHVKAIRALVEAVRVLA